MAIKNKAIAGGTVVSLIVLWPLIQFFMGLNTASVIAQENRVRIEKIEEKKEDLAKTEQKVDDLKENFTDFRGEQRIANNKFEDKLDYIIDALLNM